MAFEFIPASDPRTRFTVDIEKNGEAKTFDVPRFEFMDSGTLKEFNTFVKENTDETLVEAGKIPVEEYFDFLVNLLKIQDHSWFVKTLVPGEKKQLWDEWNRLSALPLGES